MYTNVMLFLLGVVAIYFVYRLLRSVARKVLWLATTATGSALFAGANAGQVNGQSIQNFAWLKKFLMFIF